MSIDPKRVQAVFLAVVAQHTAADRAAYLDEVCGQEVELRQRVELLLRAHDDPGSFLGMPAQGPRATAAPQLGLVEDGSLPSNEQAGEPCSSAESPGTVIDRYKLLEALGEGGMGSVWMAQQQEPVKRLVALKLIKAGMDSKAVLARFEAERQALALMDH